MPKIQGDKYYTSRKIAEYCYNKTIQVIGDNKISEFLEPSAGQGVFLEFFNKPYIAIDIESSDKNIIEADFLQYPIDYKKGRCVIGNPPFGSRNVLALRFYKKSILIGDYIAFILPISQFNNNNQMYEFDLIYSEDLGLQYFTDRFLHCCFNVYKRNSNGLNSKPNYKLKDIIIKENRRGGSQVDKNLQYDIAICSYGSGIIGKEPEYIGQYAKEFYFIINTENKQSIIDFIRNTNWEKDVCNGISGQTNLAQWQVLKHIKENFKDIE